MKIFFKEKNNLAEIQVTIEAKEKNVAVGHLMDYLADYNQTLGIYIIQMGGRIYKFPKNDIIWCEVFGDYTTIHLANEKYVFRKTLSQLEIELPERQFVRVSRSTLVNMDYIMKIESSFSGNMQAILKTNTAVQISRKYWKNIKQRILADE
ncbi:MULTISPECIES: LytTR family DNA-binding domain-containing protein [unclassified Enterococcus]|uniref:LytTR family DNA-binding domain-containing protein n=1 Tax=unclassified Enterococcus TaxID=2608891 RepID=UPI001557555E|nr:MULTISPECIES: LytTR family DNA-binding domain-containing protein [unclassified Enterococcus]MBS7576911.1 LytTR family transcriptional regulator [Enterococcus sp. MMGLQ5-2]MBS7584318.1 LytTR family transcriptional regulator [Enterococcus sp. MMGLQ5-1]NPD12174.1 LytTR family transcriptional regulator [Enterococcus sp. MMGLQ5-1]NPD36746.1 LytTR family transcriptional regulator [Enterococcus sp. MMGLQ5-2]